MRPRPSTVEEAALALFLSKLMQPHLHGHEPGVQGAALADLVSIYIAGHHPEIREAVFDQWIKSTRSLIEASAKERFGDKGWVE